MALYTIFLTKKQQLAATFAYEGLQKKCRMSANRNDSLHHDAIDNAWKLFWRRELLARIQSRLKNQQQKQPT